MMKNMDRAAPAALECEIERAFYSRSREHAFPPARRVRVAA